jgi:hypothetical protein
MAVKFMQSLDPQVYTELTKIAKKRGISMQELIRAVIVPDWMKKLEDGSRKPGASRRTGGHTRRLRRLRSTAHA